jgi:hypothetical protein
VRTSSVIILFDYNVHNFEISILGFFEFFQILYQIKFIKIDKVEKVWETSIGFGGELICFRDAWVSEKSQFESRHDP